jgi:hypothetical protein
MTSIGENDRLYAEREKRFKDIVALKKVDRVKVMPVVTAYFPTKVKGISNRDAGYDNVLRYRSMKEAVLDFGWDFATRSGLILSEGLEAVGVLQMRWPGKDLLDDAPFQFVENEWVTEDEYDELLGDPNHFTLTKILPRIASELSGLGQIQFPPLYWLSDAYNLVFTLGGMLAAPPLRKVLESLLRLADAAGANLAARGGHIEEMATLGILGTLVIP